MLLAPSGGYVVSLPLLCGATVREKPNTDTRGLAFRTPADKKLLKQCSSVSPPGWRGRSRS